MMGDDDIDDDAPGHEPCEECGEVFEVGELEDGICCFCIASLEDADEDKE